MTSPDEAAIVVLMELQARRKFYIGLANRQTNAAKALVRRALGQKWSDDEGDRAKSSARAARIVSAALNDKPQRDDDAAVVALVGSDLAVIASALSAVVQARHEIELEMKRQCRKLPVAPWVKGVRGLGELGLAVVVGEAGNLSLYPTKGHLWKRVGLAPHDGKAYSTWRREGGLSAEDWVAAGYSPRRRAEMFAVIAEPLLRAQTVCAGPYRTLYDRRRERTAAAHPEWSKLHAHLDAMRIMTKALLRDLWREWNRREAIVVLPVEARTTLPPGEPWADCGNLIASLGLEAR